MKSAAKELVRDVALSVTLQAKNRTLREEEIATVSRKVIDSVEKQTQGKFRV